MRSAFSLCLLTAVLATGAVAAEPLTLTVKNESSRRANISGVYEVRDGVAIDDNLGSSDPIDPGQTIIVPLTITACRKVEISAWLGVYPEENREEIYGKTDLCRNRTMILHD